MIICRNAEGAHVHRKVRTPNLNQKLAILLLSAGNEFVNTI